MSTKNKDSKRRPCKGLPGKKVTAIGTNAISVPSSTLTPHKTLAEGHKPRAVTLIAKLVISLQVFHGGRQSKEDRSVA